MRREQLNPHKTATFVMPGHKVVYVSVNKAACTSIKWLVADLQGEDPEYFYSSISREVRARCASTGARCSAARRCCISSRTTSLRQIGPAQGWFMFAVVRHPAARLLFRRQSKSLVWRTAVGGDV